jgi:hypothetical protein
MSDAQTSPPEEPKPDKPKPAPNWRGYVKEVGIVVLGVCLALAAQQAVEEWREAKLAREARDAIRTELALVLSDLQMRLDSSQGCVDRRLVEIGDYLAATGQGEAKTPPNWIGRPRIALVYSGQWQSAIQSGRVSLLPREEAASYANMYYMIGKIDEAQSLEQQYWAELRTLQRLPKLSPEMIKQFQVALSAARHANWRTRLSILRLQEIGQKQNLKPDPGYSFPGETSKTSSVCLPITTPPDQAIAAIGVSFGEPN